MTLPVRLLIVLAATAFAPLAVAGAPTQPRNDSGQAPCYDGAGATVPCDTQSMPGQDGRFGRDSAAGAGVLPKLGAGVNGFDYTKIANDGSELPAGATLGPGPGDWACTLDNLTGRLWEIKTNDGGMRHGQWAYHWFDPDDSRNGGDPGIPGEFELGCNFTMECDTQAYVEYVNSIAMCGRGDWRLPGLDELTGIVNFGASFPPGAMDTTYFPDGGAGGAWSADTAMEPAPEFAWMVNFDDGHAEAAPKGGLLPIRVVSGEPYLADGEPPMCGERENLQIPATTAGAFVDNGDGTVRDSRTGLVWDRCSIGQTFNPEGGETGSGSCEGEAQPMNWEQALQEVAQRNKSGYLGSNAWRLPNIKELASPLERRCAMPVLDVAVFPNPSMEAYWSSTSYHWMDQLDQAWVTLMEFGVMSIMPKGAESRVRLVRGGGEFDDYQGTPSWRVGGNVAGMVGSGLVLRLEADGAEVESLTAAADGPFAFAWGFVAGTSYSVSVSQPPIPFQVCTVTSGSGTVVDGNIGDVSVVCAAPDPVVIEVGPGALAFDVVEGGGSSAPLAIANTGGGILHWSIDTAYASVGTLRGMPAGGVIDCAAAPGLIVHDDGTVENAYTGNAAWTGGVMIVDKFTPAAYPASISAVCLAFAGSAGVDSLDFEIVVFDDNGAGSGPGTELGALAASADGIPQYPVTTPSWFGYDISSLYTTVASGSLYVGIRWQPASPSRIFVLADQSADRPADYAGGRVWNWSGAGTWTPLVEHFPDYRSMFIRATVGGEQVVPVGCDNPHAVPWLDVTPNSGSTFAGQSSSASVSVNTAGLALGQYFATLCVSSDDAASSLVQVPVSLSVSEAQALLHVAPASLDFGSVPLGASAAAQIVSVSNDGNIELGGIAPALPAAPFTRSGGSCPAAPFSLDPGEDCTIAYTFAPTTLGSHSQSLAVDSSAGSATIALSGIGTPGAPASLGLVSGSGQSAVVGEAFPIPLTVEVRDAFGNPLVGIDVSFAAPAAGPGAQLSATTATTDADGRAAVTATANGAPGAYVVTATLEGGGQHVDFMLTNVAGEPDDRIFGDGFEE